MKRAGAALVALGCLGIAGCDLSEPTSYDNKRVEGGDAARVFTLVVSGAYGCAACHAIPGIRSRAVWLGRRSAAWLSGASSPGNCRTSRA